MAPTRALVGQWFGQLADAFGAERVGAFYGDEKEVRAVTVTTYHSAFTLLERHGAAFDLLVRLDHLILVTYRGLGVGKPEAGGEAADGAGAGEVVREASSNYGHEEEASRLPGEAPAGPVLWFANKPRIGPVLEAAERVARRP